MTEKSIHMHKSVQGTTSAWRAISAWIDLGTIVYTSHHKSTCVVQVLSCNCIFTSFQLHRQGPLLAHAIKEAWKWEEVHEEWEERMGKIGARKSGEHKPDGSARFSYIHLYWVYLTRVAFRPMLAWYVGDCMVSMHGIKQWTGRTDY